MGRSTLQRSRNRHATGKNLNLCGEHGKESCIRLHRAYCIMSFVLTMSAQLARSQKRLDALFSKLNNEKKMYNVEALTDSNLDFPADFSHGESGINITHTENRMQVADAITGEDVINMNKKERGEVSNRKLEISDLVVHSVVGLSFSNVLVESILPETVSLSDHADIEDKVQNLKSVTSCPNDAHHFPKPSSFISNHSEGPTKSQFLSLDENSCINNLRRNSQPLIVSGSDDHAGPNLFSGRQITDFSFSAPLETFLKPSNTGTFENLPLSLFPIDFGDHPNVFQQTLQNNAILDTDSIDCLNARRQDMTYDVTSAKQANTESQVDDWVLVTSSFNFRGEIIGEAGLELKEEGSKFDIEMRERGLQNTLFSQDGIAAVELTPLPKGYDSSRDEFFKQVGSNDTNFEWSAHDRLCSLPSVEKNVQIPFEFFHTPESSFTLDEWKLSEKVGPFTLTDRQENVNVNWDFLTSVGE